MTNGSYVEQGKEAILDLLDREHAAVWPEIEAKLADVPKPARSIQPDILTKARRALLAEDMIAETTEVTRGSRSVGVWHLKDLTDRRRDFENAAGRKRLLYARYQSWNRSSKRYPQGLLGDAGEIVTHESLLEAAPYGYKPVHVKRAKINSLLGAAIPGGPLDNAAFLQVVDSEGMPLAPFVVPIEVKNIRHWIYPSSAELFQLLHKAALLQEARPNMSFVSVLVCRRRSFYTWEMAQELGFLPIQVYAQYVLPRSEVNRTHFEEVRSELGYTDLKLSETAEARLVRAFAESIPKDAQRLAERWKICGPPLIDYFEQLRQFIKDPKEREQLMARFRDETSHLPGCDVNW